MMKKIVLGAAAAAAIVGAALAGAAVAAPPAADSGAPKGSHRMHMQRGWADAFGSIVKEADKNGDGKVDRKELEAAGNQRFADADTDKDGKLSQAELDAAHEAAKARRKAEMFKRMDTNGNGFIEKDESMGRALKRFDTFDTDRDGTISDAERKAAHDKFRDGKTKPPGDN